MAQSKIRNLKSELLPPPPGKTGWPWTEESPHVPDTMPGDRPWPKVSIVTPSYNQGQFIEETIRSVLLQGYPNLEYIIIDGGSTDESVEIIKKYEPWLTYWVSEPDRGQSHAINKGWGKATGEILAWLNSDDTYEPGALYTAVNFLLEHPQVVIMYGDCEMIDEQGYAIKRCPAVPFDIKKLICFEWFIPQQAVFIRRSVLERVGGVDERLHLIMDTELWIRIALAGLEIQYSPQLLASIRVYPQTKTHTCQERSFKEKLAVLDGIFGTPGQSTKILAWRGEAYSNVHKLMGIDYYWQPSMGKARNHLLRAAWLYPSRLREWKVVKALILTFLGDKLILKVRKLRGKKY